MIATVYCAVFLEKASMHNVSLRRLKIEVVQRRIIK